MKPEKTEAVVKPPTGRVKLMILFLSIEFLLGMIVNLFGQAPDEATGQAKEPIWAMMIFFAHGILGLLLLIGAIFILVATTKTNNKKWQNLAVYGLGSIFLSAAGGIGVVTLGENPASEVSSFVMAVGFLLAFISYGWYFFTLTKSTGDSAKMAE
jgi:heme A synthase